MLAEEHRVRQSWRPRMGNGIDGVADLVGFDPAYRRVYAKHNRTMGFTHVHVVRDPLERLLSGFLDKCVSKRASVQYRHCPCKSCGANFSTFVTTLADRHARDPSYLYRLVDTHFRPQAVGCGAEPSDEQIIWGGTAGHLHESMQRLCA